MKSGNLQHKHF